MTTHLRAHGAGVNLSTNDEAPAVAAARGFENQKQNQSPKFRADGAGDQAAPIIAGEHCVRSYLDRLHAGTAQPGEPAAVLCYLRGELLHGACRLIEKALEGRPHA